MTPKRTYLPSINTLRLRYRRVLQNMDWESLKRDKIKTICLSMLDVQYY